MFLYMLFCDFEMNGGGEFMWTTAIGNEVLVCAADSNLFD